MWLHRLRLTELALLGLVFLSIACGFAVISSSAVQLALYAIAPFIACWAFLCLLAPQSNQLLLPIAALICGLGLVNQLQISLDYFSHQLLVTTIGAASFVMVLALVRFRPSVTSYKYLFGTLALALFFLPAVVGITRGGARLWVAIGPVVFQPSEIARVFFFVFLARYFSEHQRLLSKAPVLKRRAFEIRYLGPAVVVALLTLLLLVYVKDLGFSLLILVTFLLALYATTEKKRYPAGGLAIFALGLVGAYRLYGHVRTRIDVWLDPWPDVYGRAYQIVQGLFAYAEGGTIGRGLGNGFSSLLPAVNTDMVLPFFAETTGFAGVAVLLTAYLAFALIALSAARDASPYGRLLVIVAAGSMFAQTAIVSAGTLRLMPLTGLTMPFFSYGGSSLISWFAILALIMFHTSEQRSWTV